MFPLFHGQGATLVRALCQLALDRNSDAFTEVRPPTLVRTPVLEAVGQLPKFADDAYHLEHDDLWAIPTAEVPLTSMRANEMVPEDDGLSRSGSHLPGKQSWRGDDAHAIPIHADAEEMSRRRRCPHTVGTRPARWGRSRTSVYGWCRTESWRNPHRYHCGRAGNVDREREMAATATAVGMGASVMKKIQVVSRPLVLLFSPSSGTPGEG